MSASEVYVVLGVDALGYDQVLCVCACYNSAKKFLTTFLTETQFYDLWIEKHPVFD